jgi:GT2 family glycosyltransferase
VLIFLDGHTFPQPGALTRLTAAAETHGIAVPTLQSMDSETWILRGTRAHGGYFARHEFTTRFLPLSALPILTHGLRETWRISGGACAFRRDVFESIQGWDRGVQSFGADPSITLRAWCLGHTIAHDPAAVVGHVYRGKFRPDVRPRWSQLYANRLRLVAMLGTEADLAELNQWLGTQVKAAARTAREMFAASGSTIPDLRARIVRPLADYWTGAAFPLA